MKNRFLEYWNRKRIVQAVLMVLGGVLVYYYLVIRFALPSDEEMIAHFKAHRAEFEELVHRYRYFDIEPNESHLGWKEEEGTQGLLDKAQIERIERSGWSRWFKNPYSLETAKHAMSFSLDAKNTNHLFYRYSGLIVQPAPFYVYRSRNLRYGDIWKDYYYIPEAPRIKDGYLLWPYNIKGEYSGRRRLLTSLDAFPENWKSFECVFKQIEIHWYLSMCNGH